MQLTFRPNVPRPAAASLLGLAVLVAAVIVPGLAAGQAPEYQEYSPVWNEKDRTQYSEFRKREGLVRDILNGREDFAANRAQFNEYFQHVFKKMTVTSELGQLAERRREFLKNSFYMTNPPKDAHDALVAFTQSVMSAFVTGTKTGQFHPAVRFNAMLIIGELNQEEASGFGSNRRPPVPYSPALDFMITQLQDPNQIDEVKMAALIGILRHADIARKSSLLNSGGQTNQANGQTNQKILAAAMGIAKQKDPPEGRSLEGHAWMRRRALDILIAINAPGDDAVAEVVNDILSDPNEPVSLRLTAAEAIAKLNAVGDNDAAATAEQVAAIAVQVCKSELAWWDAEKKREEERKTRGQGGGYGGPGMMMADMGYPADYGTPDAGMMGPGMMSSDALYGTGSPYGAYGVGGKKKEEKKPVDPKVDRTQRRVKNCLYYVKLALDGDPSFAKPRATRPGEEPPKPTEAGLLAQTDANGKKSQIQALSSAVYEIFQTVDTAQPDQEKMLAALADQVAKLEGLAAAAAGPASAAPPGAAPPGSAPPGSAAPSSAPPGATPAPRAAAPSAPAPRAKAPGAAPAPATAPPGS